MTAVITQEIVRHELKRRELVVARVQDLSPHLRRITFTGDDLGSLQDQGPADHVKLFFPDPQTGELTLPQVGPDGLRASTSGTVISRDYTPRQLRHSPEGSELDIDFVLHGDSGPASYWAARAQEGDTLNAGGPRGSKLFPSGISRLVVLADESALPAAARWLESSPVPTEMLLIAEDAATTTYLSEVTAQPAAVTWYTGAARYEDAGHALRGLPQQPGTYYFLAGEANALVPLRRYLRRELGLERNVVAVDGYWKRGVIGLDHHAPLDPSDPD